MKGFSTYMHVQYIFLNMLLFLIHEIVLVLFEYIRMEYMLQCAKYFAFCLQVEKNMFWETCRKSVYSDHEHRINEYLSKKLIIEKSKNSAPYRAPYWRILLQMRVFHSCFLLGNRPYLNLCKYKMSLVYDEPLGRCVPNNCESLLWYTVRTVASDLRQGEHIPKMQNNIGRKSMLRVLRQLRSKDGGGGGWVGAVPCRATPRGARPGATFCTTAVNLRQIEFGEFGSGSAKNSTMGSNRLPSDL